MSDEITPDPRDFEAIEEEYGKLPPDASDEQRRHHYFLALMLKMIRLHDHGRLPLHLMREWDELRKEEICLKTSLAGLCRSCPPKSSWV
jgi:hypothetical protein